MRVTHLSKFLRVLSFTLPLSCLIIVVFIAFREVESPTLRSHDLKRDGGGLFAIRQRSNRTKSDRHVIGRMRMSGGRLGNEMFVYASVLGIAEQNGMIPVYYSAKLREVFNVSKRITDSAQLMNGKSTTVGEYSAFMFDETFDAIRSAHSGDVTVVGFFQSWKYFQFVDELVRREFVFLERHGKPAKNFLENTRTKHGLDKDAVYIGVHIRRGDMMSEESLRQGYSVADEQYLQRAVTYILDELIERQTVDERNTLADDVLDVVFVVCSDDTSWSQEHFRNAVCRVTQQLDSSTEDEFHFSPRKYNTASHRPLSANVVVVYSPGSSSSEQDLALLSYCNHTIMTVGTFGWWAGYLAGGITVYYKEFPTPGGNLERWFSRDDFFPSEWVGL